MEIREILNQIGLSDSEITIYVTLLKYGGSSISDISQNSGLHRTNIYDSIEKLKAKGMVSYVLKEGKQYLRASDPEGLIDYIKEQEEIVRDIVPELNKLKSRIPEKITVEIFKGKQGMKSVLRDILIKKETVLGYSVAGQMRKFLPEFADYYFREQSKNKILHRFIYIESIKNPPSKYYEIKYLSKEYIGTTMSLSYDDTILNLIWEPEMVAIRIKSKELAKDFEKHFKILWKIAKN